MTIVISDLEAAIHQGFYLTSMEGYRPLGIDKHRLSHGPDCSEELFWGKVRDGGEPGEMAPSIMIRKDPNTGVITPYMGAALSGTFHHASIQEALLKYKLLRNYYYEKLVKGTANDGDIRVDYDGHVDLGYSDLNGNRVICDIKTLSPTTFDKIVGIESYNSGSYADTKKRKSIIQSNSYAIVDKVDKYYQIMWACRNTLRYKIEDFLPEPALHKAVERKFTEVTAAAIKYLAGDKDARPPLCGISMCNYCDYKDYTCPGRVLLEKMRAV
jgi:hypothetical protein